MVSNLVSNGLGASASPYTRVSYTSLTWDWGLVIVNWVYLQLHPILTVLSDQWMGAACASSLYEGVSIYYYPSSLKKKDISVGSVGNVGKSEKSPENSPRKVFQNAYIAYTTYIGWGLEVDHWLDTVPLHSARSAVLVNIRKFFHGFFKSICGLRFATDGLTVLAISLVQLRSWILSICL